MGAPDIERRTRTTATRLGFRAAVLTVLLTIVSFGTAFATPPRSGPSCRFDECVTYPYTDIAAFFPRDYVWMFPSTLLVLVVVILVACIHYYGDAAKRPFSLVGLTFAAMSAAIISTDYFIQLTVVEPSVLQGETEGLSLFSQYNPHGVFIALEAIGYLVLSRAMLFVAPVFGGHGWLGRALQWLFVLGFAAAIVALVGFYAVYGHEVEYRFEVAVISIDWLVLTIGGVLLALLFRRDLVRSAATASGTPYDEQV